MKDAGRKQRRRKKLTLLLAMTKMKMKTTIPQRMQVTEVASICPMNQPGKT